MQVVYVGPDPAVHVVHVSGFECEAARGVPVDVPDEVASGMPGADGHPGVAGLLAQPDNWAAADEAEDAGEVLPVVDRDELEQMTVPQMTKLAADLGIDLGGARLRDDVHAAILAASRAPEPKED